MRFGYLSIERRGMTNNSIYLMVLAEVGFCDSAAEIIDLAEQNGDPEEEMKEAPSGGQHLNIVVPPTTEVNQEGAPLSVEEVDDNDDEEAVMVVVMEDPKEEEASLLQRGDNFGCEDIIEGVVERLVKEYEKKDEEVRQAEQRSGEKVKVREKKGGKEKKPLRFMAKSKEKMKNKVKAKLKGKDNSSEKQKKGKERRDKYNAASSSNNKEIQFERGKHSMEDSSTDRDDEHQESEKDSESEGRDSMKEELLEEEEEKSQDTDDLTDDGKAATAAPLLDPISLAQKYAAFDNMEVINLFNRDCEKVRTDWPEALWSDRWPSVPRS